MHYNRLIVAVITANVALVGYGMTVGGWWVGETTDLRTIATVAQANLLLAIVPRQQYVINLLGWLRDPAVEVLAVEAAMDDGQVLPRGWAARRRCGVGDPRGIRVRVVAGRDYVRGVGGVSVANVVAAAALVTLFVTMAVMGMPRFRYVAHDRFEVTHRLPGWIALGVVWINTVLFATSQRGSRSIARRCSPHRRCGC